MCWDEIDGDIWTIPGERTKVGREFRVPLSRQALAVLDEARRCSDGTPDSLVFPSARGRQITPDALSKLEPGTRPGHDPARAPLIVPRLVRRVGRQP